MTDHGETAVCTPCAAAENESAIPLAFRETDRFQHDDATMACRRNRMYCASSVLRRASKGWADQPDQHRQYIFYDYVNPTTVAPSQIFNSGLPGPFSLAAPITPPIHTTEPYNLSADSGFFFTDTQVTIYNNGGSGLTYCSNGTGVGSGCTDAYNTFDFVFTNEDITAVTVDPATPSNFLPATFGSHTGRPGRIHA